MIKEQLPSWTDVNQKQREQRIIAHTAEIKRIRESEDDGDKALLVIAEELYKRECAGLAGIPCTFQERSPGFQMRLIDRAFDMLETYKKVKKWINK